MTIETYRDRRGEHRWRLRAANGRIVATSSEGYRDRADMEAAIRLVRGCRAAPVREAPK